MKIKRHFVVLLCALLILFLGLYLAGYHRLRKSTQGSRNIPAAKSGTLRSRTTNPPEGSTKDESVEPARQQAGRPTKEEDFKRGLEGLNHVPIEFYGKVVDDDGNPLPETEVGFSIQHRNGLDSGILTNKTRTDSQGYFSISGYKGESLSVMPQKPGYVLASTNTGGIYSHMWPQEQRVPKPDAGNPVVIRMWKLRGAEKLVAINKRLRVPLSRKAQGIDLVNAEIVEHDGDLRIESSIMPGDLPNNRPFTWNITISTVGGGLQEVSQAEYQTIYQAPLEGYVDALTFTMDATNRLWQPSISATLFIKSRDGGVYSKVLFSFGFDPRENGPAEVSLHGFVNPYGSRNWEVDPRKLIHH